MRNKCKTTTVAGIKFTYCADFILRGMVATNEETGEEKVIIHSGYATKELTIRKAIADVFGLPTFRTK